MEVQMLLKNGITNATDVELLTALLGNRGTAATLLWQAGGSLFSLLNEERQTDADLCCADGAGNYADDPIVKLLAARELAVRAITEELRDRDCLGSPSEVRALLKHKLAGLPHEMFVCIQLDNQNRLIAYEELFRGTLTQTSVYPREVVKACLRVNAAGVIFAHNHPSGIAEPSRADELLTRALKDALALVDVKVLDHFIVAGTSTLSFAERGLL
jgi:DNA repair protein RadC